MAQFVSTTITVYESFFPSDTNDLAPCATPFNSPAHAYQLAGITPSNVEARINRFFLQSIFQSYFKPANIRHKAYLLHIHPTHSIW